VKPLTSRPMNSEIYLVGLEYRGIEPNVRDYMYSRLQHKYNYKEFIAPLCLVELNTEQSILHATHVIHGQQIQYINVAMHMNKNRSKYEKSCTERSKELSDALYKKLFE